MGNAVVCGAITEVNVIEFIRDNLPTLLISALILTIFILIVRQQIRQRGGRSDRCAGCCGCINRADCRDAIELDAGGHNERADDNS